MFMTAPMVHWPEVIVTYDLTDKIIFSADAFGRFGAIDNIEEWDNEARRYYIGIVGKYGTQVQSLLKKISKLDINMICPLHGPILNNNLSHYLNLYDKWSSYTPEEDGVVIAYASIYGNTKEAVMKLASMLKEANHPNVVVYDLARSDISMVVAEAFRYNKLVLASSTYNMDIFPHMKEFINHLTERNFQNRTVALIENGSWSPNAIKVMKEMLAGCKNLKYTQTSVKILSSLNDDSYLQLENLAKELSQDYVKKEVVFKNDLKALSNVGYGLYVITTNDGLKDNGTIVNAVTQVTNSPNRFAVTINKNSYSHDIIVKTNKMNVNCLNIEAPFKVFELFGFHSGKDVDKFKNPNQLRSTNNLVVLDEYINSYISLEVIQSIDLGTHTMFICDVIEASVINDILSMSYNYYLNNVKPKNDTSGKTGYVCKVCGWIYEGEELPSDIICPLCNHGASDFEKI
jgi:flavin reductase (DIM6/NTAB) family NADH-FMN oxidoreductase RutF